MRSKRACPLCFVFHATELGLLDNHAFLPLDYVVCNRVVDPIYRCAFKNQQKDLRT